MSVEKTYWALVETAGMHQRLPDTGRVDLPLLCGKGDGGESWRAAATGFTVLARSDDFAWLELRPETGVCALCTRWRIRQVLACATGSRATTAKTLNLKVNP
jgi:hypothetical protein